MAPSSRRASCWKPKVAYRTLNFDAAWKKQIVLPSFVYAGIPYQVFDARAGAAALTISWMRAAIERSGSGISAIFARRSASPAALSAPRFAARFASATASFIAAFSSAVQISDFAVFCAMAGSSLPTDRDDNVMLVNRRPTGFLKPDRFAARRLS